MYKGREYDSSWREPLWERATEELGGDLRAKEIVAAFKKMYTMYTDDIVEWYANLYDPHIGGYYCSTSGKENEGFLPDIESTVQALRFISSSGMISHLGGDYSRVISDEMKDGIIRFAKRMQEPNGYFYNLLKTQEEIDSSLSRRGRDLGWCTQLLDIFGVAPTYDTPNGYKGSGIDYNGKPVKIEKTLPIISSSDNGAATNYPEYLKDKESFLAYLDTVDIVNQSYYFGNQLSATKTQIMARDLALREEGANYSLCDILMDWLAERIDSKTGYWSPLPTFAGTNGFFKVMMIYNSWERPYPAPVAAVRSVIDGILGDEPSTTNICEVFNLWQALISAKTNVIKYHSPEVREKVLADIRELMLDRGAEAILNTYKKQSAYQMSDGSFSHAVNRTEDRTKQRFHQGNIPTGLYLNEGDVDAVGKAMQGITSAMFSALGITPVPIYHEREWNIYKTILDQAKPVIKENTKTYR